MKYHKFPEETATLPTECKHFAPKNLGTYIANLTTKLLCDYIYITEHGIVTSYVVVRSSYSETSIIRQAMGLEKMSD